MYCGKCLNGMEENIVLIYMERDRKIDNWQIFMGIEYKCSRCKVKVFKLSESQIISGLTYPNEENPIAEKWEKRADYKLNIKK